MMRRAQVVALLSGKRQEIARLSEAKSTAEETAKRIISEAERDVETSRKSAVISGKEEVMRLRETAEQDLRSRRTTVEQEERRVTERESMLDLYMRAMEQAVPEEKVARAA